MRAIIERGYARATEVLTKHHRPGCIALADKLIAEETVEAEEFEKLFADLPPKENLHGISLADAAGRDARPRPKSAAQRAARPDAEPRAQPVLIGAEPHRA